MKEEKDIDEPIRKRGRFFALGPAVILLSFAYTLTGIVLTDLIVYRTCLVSLNIDDTECSSLRTNASSPEAAHLEAKVEPSASVIVMAKLLLESVIPSVLSVFLGSWSDRGGRKPLLLAGFTGFTIMFVTLAVMCGWDINPWYLLAPSIPSCLTGGTCTILLAAICHVSDVTSEKDRMVLMAWLEASIFSGQVLSGLIGPLIHVNYGYINVFRIAAVCSTAALAIIYFCVPETVENTSRNSIRGLFKVSLVKELVTSTSVKREGFAPFVVWLSVSVFTLNAMIDKGHQTVDFLFTRTRLGWGVQHYFYFNTAGVVLRIIGLYGVSLRERFPDTLLAGMGFASALGAAVTKSLVWKDWHMYLAVCIGMFSGIMPSVMRSVISNFVPPEDIGKVFSLATLLEVLSPMCGAPLYTLVYSHYLPPIYPSPVYLVSTAFFVLLILCVVRIDSMVRKSRNLPIYIGTAQDDL